MRTMLLLPLALAASVAASGCRTASDRAEQTAFGVPKRDLTLQQAENPGVEVASPVELGRSTAPPSMTHRLPRARRPRPAPRPQAAEAGAASATLAPAPAAAETHAHVAPVATAEASEAPDPHALAPGQTVTVIPVSTGSSSAPSSGPDWTDERPSGAGRGTVIHAGGHGGGCRPRGGGGGTGSRGGGFRDLR